MEPRRSAECGIEAVADLRGGQRPAHETACGQRDDQGEGKARRHGPAHAPYRLPASPDLRERSQLIAPTGRQRDSPSLNSDFAIPCGAAGRSTLLIHILVKPGALWSKRGLWWAGQVGNLDHAINSLLNPFTHPPLTRALLPGLTSGGVQSPHGRRTFSVYP